METSLKPQQSLSRAISSTPRFPQSDDSLTSLHMLYETAWR